MPFPAPHPRQYACLKATSPVPLDGRLDSGDWLRAPWTEDFVDIQGPSAPTPRFRTRAKMLWDEECLYVGAELEEPNVSATLTEHDSVIFQDNDFEIFIDPDGDNHNYFEIEINALNTEWDLRLPRPYRDGGPALNEWEIPGLRSAVCVRGTLNKPTDRDDGWSVVLAIPWPALAEHAGTHCPPAIGDRWRLDFSRVEWTVDVLDGVTVKRTGLPEDNWVWSPQGVVDMHRPETWGYVHFLGTEDPCGHLPDDPGHIARMWLMEVYHAQRRRTRPALSLQEIHGLPDPSAHGLVAAEIVAIAGGWQASVRLASTGVGYSVRHDSRLRQEQA